ncbi:MAG: hypothetical protein U0359_35925 [Byssovorax sp.]
MKMRSASLLGFTALVLLGCGNKETPSPAPEKAKPAAAAPVESAGKIAAAPAASATGGAAATSASAAAAPALPPACKVAAEKVWAKGANKLTGLTHLELADGRIAIGMAIGNTPHSLLVAKGGDGKLAKLTISEKSALNEPVKAGEGDRQILRVTPTKVTGDKVEAFIDHKTTMKNKDRHVACGPAEAAGEWIEFKGRPLLDREEKPTDDEMKQLMAKREADADEGYHELRECRSFVDPHTGEAFIIGSELWANPESDGKLTWKSSLVIDTGANSHEKHLKELDLKGEPIKVTNFDVPELYRLPDKRFLLTARYGGSFLVGILNADRSLHGAFQTYPGMPTRPELSEDGDDLVLTTSIVKDKGWQLRAMRINMKDPKLPKALTAIDLGDESTESKSDPDFTVDSKGHRWVTYVEGERGKGALMIAPVDKDFKVTGRAFEIAPKESKVSEARLNAFKEDGVLSVILLRDNGGQTELVSQDLTCEVMPR